MVNSHACISTYLQIDQETISRRDDSSSRHVSINKSFCVKREKLQGLILTSKKENFNKQMIHSMVARTR